MEMGGSNIYMDVVVISIWGHVEDGEEMRFENDNVGLYNWKKWQQLWFGFNCLVQRVKYRAIRSCQILRASGNLDESESA